jgi:ABC-type multidrug transport system fused ATPase/permease subunit
MVTIRNNTTFVKHNINTFKKIAMKKSIYLTIFLLLTCFTNPVYSFERVERVSYIEEKQIKKKHKSTPLNQIEILVATKKEGVVHNKKRIKNKSNTSNNNNVASTIFSVFSILFFLIGFIVFLFANWIAGLVYLFIGLIFLILALATRKSSKEIVKQEIYKDVVYLKNGSIVKGVIVEQIPNLSLKIETGDGSIFVYKMDEVEKIGKEKSK